MPKVYKCEADETRADLADDTLAEPKNTRNYEQGNKLISRLKIQKSITFRPCIAQCTLYSVIIANCHQKTGFFEHLYSSEISEQYLIFFVLVLHLIISNNFWKKNYFNMHSQQLKY